MQLLMLILSIIDAIPSTITAIKQIIWAIEHLPSDQKGMVKADFSKLLKGHMRLGISDKVELDLTQFLENLRSKYDCL